MIERRTVLARLAGAALLPLVPACAAGAGATRKDEWAAAMAALEAESGGRLGVAFLDAGTGTRFAWRGDERFPMCSTFKFLLAAAILFRVDRGLERLDRPVAVEKDDLVAYSPFAKTRVGASATVAELTEATLQRSDNAAANLLLAPLGGPQGLTRWLRGVGDPVTRLDRIEPAMNDVKGADPRDTTTPAAMVADLDRFLLGDVLSPASRARLLAWMKGNLTGDGRIRAGVPAGWTVADKTGTCGRGSYNDVGLVQPPGRPPMLLAIYMAGGGLEGAAAEAIHARITKALLASG